MRRAPTPEQANANAERNAEIRKLVAGGMRQTDAARRFGLNAKTVWEIVHRQGRSGRV